VIVQAPSVASPGIVTREEIVPSGPAVTDRVASPLVTDTASPGANPVPDRVTVSPGATVPGSTEISGVEEGRSDTVTVTSVEADLAPSSTVTMAV